MPRRRASEPQQRYEPVDGHGHPCSPERGTISRNGKCSASLTATESLPPLPSNLERTEGSSSTRTPPSSMPRVFPSLEPTTLLIHKGKALPFHEFGNQAQVKPTASTTSLHSLPPPFTSRFAQQQPSHRRIALSLPLYRAHIATEICALSPSRPFMGLIIVRYQLAVAIPLPMSPVACPMLLEVKIRVFPPSSFSRRAGRAD